MRRAVEGKFKLLLGYFTVVCFLETRCMQQMFVFQLKCIFYFSYFNEYEEIMGIFCIVYLLYFLGQIVKMCQLFSAIFVRTKFLCWIASPKLATCAKI